MAKNNFYGPWPVLFVVFFMLLNVAGVGQVTPPPPVDQSLHTPNYFIRMEQKRLTDVLAKALASQATESARVAQLVSKNDSLLNAGIMEDSISAGYTQRLRTYQAKHDSVTNAISLLQKQVSSLGTLKNNFTAMVGRVNAVDAEVNRKVPLRQSLLLGIDKQMDSFNLSGAKKQFKTILNSASSQTAKEEQAVVEVATKKDSLLALGTVDTSTAATVDQRLASYKRFIDSATGEINELKQKLESPAEFRKEFRLIKARVILIDSVVNKSASSREYVYTMIDDALSKSKPKLFAMGAFFGPGGYSIPKEKYTLARKYFSPVIDSLIKFSNQYHSILRIGTIVVNGYADATTISPGTKLFDTISSYTGQEHLTKEELNIGLSKLRAERLSQFLTQLLKEKSPEFVSFDKIVFEALESGKGESYPDPKVVNYKSNDERRRIVIIFWSVLPSQ